MTIYSCPRCGYTCRQKRDMRKHLLRKFTCKPILLNISVLKCFEEVLSGDLEIIKKLRKKTRKSALKCVKNEKKSEKCVKTNALFMSALPGEEITDSAKETTLTPPMKPFFCNFCTKRFKRKRYLKQHLERYSCKKRKDHKLDRKDIIIGALKDQVQQLLSKAGQNTYNTTYNNTYNIVVLNAYGKEDISYLDETSIKSIMNKGPFKSIPALIKHLHFNPDFQQNHNIKIPNKKLPWASIYNGDQWEYRDKVDTIDDLSHKAYGIINDHYDGGDKYMDNFKEQFTNDEHSLTKRIHKDVELVILNNQN